MQFAYNALKKVIHFMHSSPMWTNNEVNLYYNYTATNMNNIHNLQAKKSPFIFMILANVTYNGCGQNEQRRGVYPLRQVKQWSPLSHAEEGRWAWECRREPWHVAVPVPPLLLDIHALSVDHRSIAPTELKGHSFKNHDSTKKSAKQRFFLFKHTCGAPSGLVETALLPLFLPLCVTAADPSLTLTEPDRSCRA